MTDIDLDVLAIADDRPRHPYVAEHPAIDPSAREWTYPSGETCTAELQGWSSRMAFHEIEALKAMLTPRGALYAIQMLLHQLTPVALADSTENFNGFTAEALEGPMLATVDCERLFGDRLLEALAIIEELLERCPGCGRKHGEIGWVHVQTGRAVRVDRREAGFVFFSREFAPGRWTHPEAMPSAEFERWHVPADQVSLLGEESSS